MDRRETLCSMFDATGFGLEIGPSYSPVLPKSAGYTVETLDYASRDELRHKYRNDTVDIDLRAIGAIGLGIQTMRVTEEIVVVLRRDAPVATHDRLALMREMNEDHDRATQRAALQDARSAIQRQDAELDQRRAEMERLTAALAHERETCKAARIAMDAEAEALRQRIAALEASTSWRLTAPMRALRRSIGAG